MAEKIKMNNIEIAQPDTGLRYSLETTFTSDSTRLPSGSAVFTPMFTAEAFDYTRTGLTGEEMQTILQIIGRGMPFMLHYHSPFYNGWRDAPFRVGKVDNIAIGQLNDETGLYDSLSFHMTGENPI